jgi:hypothetical protein
VWVDGAARGSAPLSITDLPAGRHEVRVKTNSGMATERVIVAAGSVVNFVVSTPAQPAPASATARPAPPKPPTPLVQSVPAPGTVVVALPFDVQIYEDGRFVGTSGSEATLQPGAHRIELVNKSLNYRAQESVQVESGKTARIPAAAPMGSVSLNALPWAEVIVDGRRIGETPLGQVPIPVGAHEVVFHHPQLGEQTRSVIVTAGVPTRVTVDLRK